MLTDEEISEFVLKQKPKNTLTKTKLDVGIFTRWLCEMLPVFKRLKSHALFIRCRIKRLLDVLLYNTGYIWTRTQLEKSYWTRPSNMTYQAVYMYSSKYISVLNVE